MIRFDSTHKSSPGLKTKLPRIFNLIEAKNSNILHNSLLSLLATFCWKWSGEGEATKPRWRCELIKKYFISSFQMDFNEQCMYDDTWLAALLEHLVPDLIKAASKLLQGHPCDVHVSRHNWLLEKVLPHELVKLHVSKHSQGTLQHPAPVARHRNWELLTLLHSNSPRWWTRKVCCRVIKRTSLLTEQQAQWSASVTEPNRAIVEKSERQ